MTKQNDLDDEVARKHGFQVVDHPRGRNHAHSSYIKGRVRIWMINGFRDGLWWRSAIVRDNRYTAHESHETLEEALKRDDVG